ncbi:glycoside hydrolase superfamily [Ganoderma leucocontextum]|nr:glycoside hydrolase superfamily [Ganoderma leucocontextum]
MALSAVFKRVLFIAAVALAAVSDVEAMRVMRRPANYNGTATNHAVSKRAASGKVNAAYFTNWAIYSGFNFQPTEINPAPLTHILYSFADISPDDGTIKLTDSWADEEKHYPGDSWSDPGNNLYGCLKQMYLLKLAHRNLKVLLSVGGWTYSQSGHFNFITDAGKRSTFVSTAVQLVEDYGFDGIDIDFEFPSTDALGSGFASLVSELRTAFDNLQTKKGDSTPYLITAATSAGQPNYEHMKFPQMNEALTFWNLMAYDYAGSWLTFADNQANLYGGSRTNVSTDKAIKDYISRGASASKINLGLPLYGRAFENTDGIGKPYNGVGPGTVEAGVYSYKFLPLAGATVHEDTTDVASYSYDSSKRELVSYDTPDIAKIKARYVQSKGLGGTFFWDLSTDKTGDDSLIDTTAGVFGGLDQTPNHIHYPNSKWDNIKNNMGQGSGGSGPTTTTTPHTSTTSTRSPTTSTRKSTTTSHSTTTSRSTATSRSSTHTTTTTSSGTQPTGGSGKCSGVAAWGSQTIYVGGQSVTYNGHLWTASWWTDADTPGGAAGVWVDKGAC